MILREDFLAPLGVSLAAFAAHLGVPSRRVREILRGTRSVRAATAWLFAGALGTTPELWLQMQVTHDLAATRPQRPVRRFRSA